MPAACGEHRQDVARDAGDMEQELGYLQRYLVSRPDDNDQRERYAKLMVKLAKHPKQFQECFIVMEDVLRRDPGRDELRRYLVEFAITKAGLPDEAKGHLDILMAKYPNDGVLEDQYAAIKHYERDYKAAAKWYADAHAHKPDLFNAYIGHSLMLRQHLAEPVEADKVMAEMAEKNPNSFKAHLIRADYARKYDQPDLAKTELATARKLGPDELDVIILGSEMTYAEARQLRRTANSKPAVDAKLGEVRAELDRARK